MAVRERQRLITVAAVFAIAAIILMACFIRSTSAMSTRTLLVNASYLYLNNDLNNEAATQYFYLPGGTWAAIRFNIHGADYFDISTDNGSTWNRITTENIDSVGIEESTTMSNLGAGVEIYKDIDGYEFRLRTLDPLHAALGIYENGNVIEFDFHPGAVVHALLQGLTVGDDHTQYQNNARGDARYYKKEEVDTQGEVEAIWSVNLATDSELSSHTGDTSDPHSVTKTQVGLSNVENLKVKLDATVSPTVNEDSADGYSVGSLWNNTTDDETHICLDATEGAAVWIEITSILGSDPNAIHDNAAAEIYAITLKASPVDADVFIIEDSEAGNAKKRVPWSALPGAGGGEANTMSNLGAGVGIYEGKSGVDLRLNSLNPVHAALSIYEDDGDDEIDFDFIPGAVVHNDLQGLTVGDPHTQYQETDNVRILFQKTLIDPNGLYDIDQQFVLAYIGEEAPNGVTITAIRIETDNPSYEITGILGYADDFQAGANAIAIDTITTSGGKIVIISGFDDATVPNGKTIYLVLSADPNALMKQFRITVWGTSD